MRKKIVAGNWKMNKTLKEGIELAKEIELKLEKQNVTSVGVIIGTPFIHLAEVSKIVDHNLISVAAQNCSSEPKGAFTGEVSAEMIKSTGSEYVIIGHSERRNYFNEDNKTLHKKVKLALENGLNPIFCVGEQLDERKNDKQFDVVKKQLNEGLFDLTGKEFSSVVIAYEPVWAIGTGETATPQQAQEIHKYIRKLVSDNYNEETADSTTILYGGSCKPSNAKDLFVNNDVDGGLIGGASLKADDFIEIINSFNT